MSDRKPHRLTNLVFKFGDRKVGYGFFSDPTPGSLVANRVVFPIVQMVALHSNATDAEKMDIFDLMTVLGLKLISVCQHRERYIAREDELIRTARAAPIVDTETTEVEIITAQDLYLELDGFMVQLKSALDHMTSFLAFAFRLPHGGLTTFGDGGAAVVRILRNNSPKDSKRIAFQLTKVIEGSQAWLREAKVVRDRMNHFTGGGTGIQDFVVFVRIDRGLETLVTPLINERPVREVMESWFRDLIDFVEYFLGMALRARMPGVHLMRLPAKGDDPAMPRWRVISDEEWEANKHLTTLVDDGYSDAGS